MALATNLSFSKTAEELFISQPAISRQISLLERELGAKLFKRNNRGTELTEVGQLYFELFSRYKAELIDTKIAADMITGKSKAVMRVGFLEGWDLLGVVPPMIDKYKAAFPDSELVVNCCGVKELSSGLLTDSLDVIVTMSNSIRAQRDFVCTDIMDLGKVLIFSAKHPLADKENDELSLRDFKDDLFLAPWEIVDKMVIEAIYEYTRPYGFMPKLRFVKNHESIITCVRGNIGVAIVDEWVYAKDVKDIRWFPFSASDKVCIARRRNRTDEHIEAMETILEDILRK